LGGIRTLVAACLIAHAQSSPSLPAQVAAAPLPAVYTAAQAKRGASVYLYACSGCHLYDLSGGRDPDGLGDAPPLAGEKFLRDWNRETIAAFLNVVRTTMPFDKPGELKPDEYLDVVAYVLSVNKFPAGNTELGRDQAALQQFFGGIPK
jgi:cytochrome c